MEEDRASAASRGFTRSKRSAPSDGGDDHEEASIAKTSRARMEKASNAKTSRARMEKASNAREPKTLLDTVIRNGDVFGVALNYWNMDDITTVRAVSRDASQRLLAVPSIARGVSSHAAEVVDRNPSAEALRYARELLAKPYVLKFLSEVLFPAETAFAHWLERDPDVRLLLSRSRTVPVDEKKRVIYAGTGSIEMAPDKTRFQYGSRFKVESDAVERVCPANTLWARCWKKFLTQCYPRIEEVFQGLSDLNFATRNHFIGWHQLHFNDLEKYYTHLLPDTKPARVAWYYDVLVKASDYATIFKENFKPENAESTKRSEEELRRYYLDTVNPITCSYVKSYKRPFYDSFEQFVTLHIPVMFRCIHASLVFMHSSFSYMNELRTIYGPTITLHGITVDPRAFDPHRQTREVGRLAWVTVPENNHVFHVDDDPHDKPQMDIQFNRAYEDFEKYEFGLADWDLNPSQQTKNNILPQTRLTQTKILQGARFLFVKQTDGKYRALQRGFARSRYLNEADRKALREQSEAALSSENLFTANAFDDDLSQARELNADNLSQARELNADNEEGSVCPFEDLPGHSDTTCLRCACRRERIAGLKSAKSSSSAGTRDVVRFEKHESSSTRIDDVPRSKKHESPSTKIDDVVRQLEAVLKLFP